MTVEECDPVEPDRAAAGVAAFAFEPGVLKNLRRTGWSHAGISDAESIAEHSLRVAQLASLIAAEEGADPARAALMAIWHDSQETRTGDIPHTAKPYLTARIDPEAVTADQIVYLSEAAAKTVRETVAEYEKQANAEARCARDADRLECLVQAVEYRESGHFGMEGWISTSRAAIRTETAARIADVAVRLSPLVWRNR